ncbi:helix-turn-helix transcriptional regulator [Gemmatimonadota bacterium]
MDVKKRKKLEAAGWKVGGVDEFLGLSTEEVEFIEAKLALANSLKERRKQKRMTQEQLAKKIGSSQSRVAKMEAADPTVSLDALIKALQTLGMNMTQIGLIIGSGIEAKVA